MAAEIKVSADVTPSLHPNNVDALDGFDEQTAPYVQQARTALSEAYEGIREIHEAKLKVSRNAAWTEANQILMVAAFAEKKQERILSQIDGARANLIKAADSLDRNLSTPLEQQAAAGNNIPSEIRSHVKNLSSDERMKFLNSAMESNDFKSLSSILGAPPFLSGISPEMQKTFTRLYHERQSPESVKRLKVTREAIRFLEEKGPLVFGEIEKAVGANSERVKRLRAAHDEAEKALILRDNGSTK